MRGVLTSLHAQIQNVLNTWHKKKNGVWFCKRVHQWLVDLGGQWELIMPQLVDYLCKYAEHTLVSNDSQVPFQVSFSHILTHQTLQVVKSKAHHRALQALLSCCRCTRIHHA
jgi:hypothetical protein